MTEADKQAKAVIEVLSKQNNISEVDTVQVICAAYQRGKKDAIDEMEKIVRSRKYYVKDNEDAIPMETATANALCADLAALRESVSKEKTE